MPFLITGNSSDGERSAIRNAAASAIVLAMKWERIGLTDVRITPPGKTAQDFRTFQAKHYQIPRSV